MYNIGGVDKETYTPNYESLLKSIHPDDKHYFAKDQPAFYEDGNEFEHRIILPDGTVKWIHERGRYILDKSGNPVIFEGTSQDITERLKYINAIETQNQKLKDISWIQSHVVRAPIARLMSLIDLIQNHHSPDEEMQQLLQHVLQSAHDLDNVLREISKNAEQIDIVWDRRI